MAVNFRGYLFQDDGDAVNGATVQLLETGTTTEEATTTTDSNGAWSFTETSLDATYDVKITSGSSVRNILWSDEITAKGVDTASLKVRGANGAVAPIYFFADQADDAGDAWRIQASASDTLAIGSDKASAGTIIDYLTITNGANAAASVVAAGGDLTVGDDLSLTSDSAVLNMGAGNDFTITHDGTTGATIAGNPLTLDSGADIVLDAEGADVILKDGGTQYGSLTNSSSNLLIKSGSTTAATFSGANVTLAGTVGSGAITSSGIIKTDNTTEATSTTDGSLQTDGGLSVAKDAVFGDDVFLLSDSAVFNMGAGNDFTITHDGTTGATLAGNPITITASGASTWSTSSGALTITSAAAATWSTAAGALTIDGDDGITLQTTGSGNVTVSEILDITDATDSSDATGDTGALRTEGGASIAKKLYVGTDLDVDGTTNLDAVDIDGNVQLDGTLTVGVDGTGLDVKFFGATSGNYMLWDESTDDLILAGSSRLYMYDAAGDEYLLSDGTDLTIAAGTDLNLTAGTDINIPTNVGLTFGNDGEKIEGDGTDLTIAGNKINLTPADNVLVANGTGVVVGHTAQVTAGAASELQVLGTGSPDASLLIGRFSADVSGPTLRFVKSRDPAIADGSFAIVEDGDSLGEIFWKADDGGDFATTAASIKCVVDGTPGSNDMPGSLIFYTTPDGSTGKTEAMRITSSQTIEMNAVVSAVDANDRPLVVSSTDSTPTAGSLNLAVGSGPGILFKIPVTTSVGIGAAIDAVKTVDSDADKSTGLSFKISQNDETLDEALKIDHAGDVTGTHGDYHVSSDARLKENVSTISDALEKVSSLRGVNFTWKDGRNEGSLQMGFIAQEVEAVVPEVVHTQDTEEALKAVEYQYITALLVEAVKDLSAEVSALKS